MRLLQAFGALALLSAIGTASNVSPANAATFQYKTYAFANDGLADFKYYGGDELDIATAEISGKVVVGYDAEYDASWFSLVDAKFHSAKQVAGDVRPTGAAWLEGQAVDSIMPGIHKDIFGRRIHDSEFFLYDPFVTPNNGYIVHFVLSTDPAGPRLSGKASALATDSSTYYLDAKLVEIGNSIPEPSSLMLLAIGAAAWGRRKSTRLTSPSPFAISCD